MNVFKKYQEIINYRIKDINIKGQPQELYDPISYILNLKSKRVRPTLCLLSYSIFSKNIKTAVEPAIALEFFHNFTLIHDDIMDNANIRRGEKTIHNKWNNNIGILSGDLLMIFAYKMLECVDNNIIKNTLGRFNEIAIKVCEGQQFDMNFENKELISESEYIKMITLKTAVLIGFSLELGGLIANQKKKITDKLYRAGEKIGISFQLMDDYLDVFGNSKFGKEIGGDISSNKKTYLMIKLLERADEPDKKIINNLLSDKKDNSTKVKKITQYMVKYKIDELTKKIMDEFFVEGISILESIPGKSSELKKYFEGIRRRKF
tara:strand:+ start:5655 stop:6614 length:960 start_codon:yes stop_codon:yes gene_type:complete